MKDLDFLTDILPTFSWQSYEILELEQICIVTVEIGRTGLRHTQQHGSSISKPSNMQAVAQSDG